MRKLNGVVERYYDGIKRDSKDFPKNMDYFQKLVDRRREGFMQEWKDVDEKRS